MRAVPWFRLYFLVLDDGHAVRETRFGSSSGSEARGIAKQVRIGSRRQHLLKFGLGSGFPVARDPC